MVFDLFSGLKNYFSGMLTQFAEGFFIKSCLIGLLKYVNEISNEFMRILMKNLI